MTGKALVPLQGEIIPPGKPGRKKGVVWGTEQEEQAARVLELIAGGDTITGIGNDTENGLPSKSTLHKWRAEVICFADGYARAREARADARADRIDGYREKLEKGELLPNQARTLFDMDRWQAGKENQGLYGDKAIIEGGDKPIIFTELSEIDAVNKLALLLSGARLDDS